MYKIICAKSHQIIFDIVNGIGPGWAGRVPTIRHFIAKVSGACPLSPKRLYSVIYPLLHFNVTTSNLV